MIKTQDIITKIKKIVISLSYQIDKTTCQQLITAENCESNDLSRFALSIMNQNIKIAKEQKIPACQDTGMVIVFAKVGYNARIDGDLYEAINEGVRRGYKNLRKSILDPVTRINTKDNTPAVIYTELVEGNCVTLDIMAKGFGSENMSSIHMLSPSNGVDGIKRAVCDTVKAAGGCPCPPVIVGVGLGGTMDKAAILSKKALFREIGSKNTDNYLDNLERQLLTELNKLKIGAGGFGGDTTALAVFIESYPTHIAGMPVAVSICCHCNRHKSVRFGES